LGGNDITAADVFLAVKTLKAAGFDEICPEVWNRELLWLMTTRVFKWPEALEGQTGVIISMPKKGNMRECTHYQDIFC